MNAVQSGRINGRVGCVIGSEADSGVLSVAKEMGIPGYHIDRRTHGDVPSAERAMIEVFRRHGVELICLVGYRKKIRSVLLEAFPMRIINLHPAPIPEFGGKGLGGIMAQQAVLVAKAPYTGPVVHIVDEEYDHGPVLAYWPIKVHEDDTDKTLERRCNEVGWELWVRTLQNVLEWMDRPKDF